MYGAEEGVRMMNKKYAIKIFVSGLGLSLVILMILFGQFTLVNVSNALGVVAILCIVLGAFRQATYLRFFDLTVFGTKKLYEMAFKKDFEKKDSKIGEYHDYVKTVYHEKNFVELYVVGIVMIFLSLASTLG